MMISCMISPLPSTRNHAAALAGADFPPEIRTDYDSDSVRVMDSDEERDFADQGPPPDFEIEEDTQILATLLKHIPACIHTADIELLLQDIPVQPPVVIPARTMQEAVQAKDLPPLDMDGRTFCFPPDHLSAAQARVHPQLLRQGRQQISGEH